MSKSHVGIVGAGLAGLTAAYRLKQVGIPSIIYEGSRRAGGRILTGSFPNGQIFQKGGEFIDTDQEDIIELIEELGLELLDLIEAEKPGTKEVFQVIDYDQTPPQPVIYTIEEATADYIQVFPRVAEDAEAAYPGDTFETNAASTALDKITLEEYANDICSILRPDGDGAKSKFAQLLKVAYTDEYGAQPDVQSSLNLILLMGFGEPDEFSLFGPSDERFTVKGGNSLLIDRLVEELSKKPNPVQIKYGYRLTKVERLSKKPNPYLLEFDVDGKCYYNVHQRIVLAMPFATMRKDPHFPCVFVDLKCADFSPLKLYTINNMPMGVNSKLSIQFEDRFWEDLGYNGSSNSTSDTNPQTSYQTTWEATRGQPGETGILVNYTGGDYAANFVTAMDIEDKDSRNFYVTAITNDFLAKVEPVFPGASDNFEFETPQKIRNVNVTGWKKYPWSRGSYSYYKLGQYSAGKGKLLPNGKSFPPGSVVPFANTEFFPEPQSVKNPKKRNCYFAGEQTSFDYQGYMNGAVVSGNRVVEEILESLH